MMRWSLEIAVNDHSTYTPEGGNIRAEFRGEVHRDAALDRRLSDRIPELVWSRPEQVDDSVDALAGLRERRDRVKRAHEHELCALLCEGLRRRRGGVTRGDDDAREEWLVRGQKDVSDFPS